MKRLIGTFLLLGLLLGSPLRAFISPDPEGHVASMDLYSYCNGDPVNQYDADGRLATSAGNGYKDASAGGLGIFGQNNYGNYSSSRNMFGYSIGSTAGSLLGTANGVAGLALGGGIWALNQGAHTVGETLGGPAGYEAIQTLPLLRLESLGISLAEKTTAVESRAIVPYQAWPTQAGFLGGYSQLQTAQEGQILSRIGDLSGHYVSPPGTSLAARGLPSYYPNTAESLWEVVKPFKMESGLAAAWQDASGLGIQHKMEQSVQNLWEFGFIKPSGGQ